MKQRLVYNVGCDIILLKDNKVLLARRTNTDWGNGKWNLIGGHVEEGETSTNCIIRECKEELGIDIQNPKIVHVIQHKSDRYTIQYYFTCDSYIGEPSILPELDIEKGIVLKADMLNWFDLDNLPSGIIPTAKQAIEEFLKGDYFSTYGFDNKKMDN